MSAKEVTETAIASSKVVVFSKTYCPYCSKAKALLDSLGAQYEAIELDKRADGSQIQAYLAEKTGQRTVPNVFISGKQIGGEPPGNVISAQKSPATIAEEFIAASKVAVFSKTTCPYCKRAKGLLNCYNATYSVLELNLRPDGPLIQEYLANKTGQHTVPNIFIRGAHIGGCDALFQLDKEGKLKDLLAGL
ncbi:hypothetical protein HDU81_003015 [Chytriomyces hyalinus]|nr:hypothetical protein HDU81_003015 [Chytriomyces hyalinus]